MPTSIYHITHIDNLGSIVAAGGLVCDRKRQERQIACQGIAHQHIKGRRAARKVPIPPGGTLADYVPFYFAPRSPMLYAIHSGVVANYPAGQRPILHLVSSAETAAASLRCIYTDGHAEIAFSAFHADIRQLGAVVDLALMASTYWNDTPEHPDRKRRRQAEFLVHQFFPWSLVESVGVADQQMKQVIDKMLEGAEHRPPVQVRPRWYY